MSRPDGSPGLAPRLRFRRSSSSDAPPLPTNVAIRRVVAVARGARSFPRNRPTGWPAATPGHSRRTLMTAAAVASPRQRPLQVAATNAVPHGVKPPQQAAFTFVVSATNVAVASRIFRLGKRLARRCHGRRCHARRCRGRRCRGRACRRPRVAVHVSPSACRRPRVAVRVSPSACRRPRVAGRVSPAARRRPLVAVRSSPSARHRPLVAVRSSPSARRRPLVAVRSSPSARRRPRVAVRSSPSARRRPLVAVRSSPSTRRRPLVAVAPVARGSALNRPVHSRVRVVGPSRAARTLRPANPP